MPRSATLRLHRPEGFESAEAFDAQLAEALASLEAQAAAERASQNRPVLGAASVLSQKRNARRASGEPRRNLSPRIACRDKWKRIEALNRLAEFVNAFREAFGAWRKGTRTALFPPGTYPMRITHRVCCAVIA